jgi:hypothetical protein
MKYTAQRRRLKRTKERRTIKLQVACLKIKSPEIRALFKEIKEMMK